MLRFLVLNHCKASPNPNAEEKGIVRTFFWAGDTVECVRRVENTLFFDDGKGGECKLVFPDECLRQLN